MKPFAEMARKIQNESTNSTDNESPNGDENPSNTSPISAIANVPAALSALEAPVMKTFSLELVIQPSSLEVIQEDTRASSQAEMRAEIRVAIQEFGENIASKQEQLRVGVR